MTEETNKASGEYVLAVIRASADELPDTHAAPLDDAARFVSALIAERDALRAVAECYAAICETPMAYDTLKRHGLTAKESPYDFCNRLRGETFARTSPGAPK